MNATECFNSFDELSYQVNIVNNQSILVVNDHLNADSELVSKQLKKSGYKVDTVYGFQQGLKYSTTSKAAIVILDWDKATDLSLAFVIAFKQNPLTKNIPLIFVTTTFDDQIIADYLSAGVDDYVIKPCLNNVLSIRVRFALLQVEKFLPQNQSITFLGQSDIPKIKFDSAQKLLLLDFKGRKATIELCPIGFKLLYLLAQNPDKPVSRMDIKIHLCGTVGKIDDRTVDVYIRRLRLALSKNNIEEIIRTVRGVGYSFNSSLVNYLLA
ncbi:response regulator transcription factor [Acinetobacter tandoii]